MALWPQLGARWGQETSRWPGWAGATPGREVARAARQAESLVYRPWPTALVASRRRRDQMALVQVALEVVVQVALEVLAQVALEVVVQVALEVVVQVADMPQVIGD